MSHAAWIDVEADFADAVRHLGNGVALFGRGGFDAPDLAGYAASMAFMHAMQSGYTSLEAGFLRILDLLEEERPVGADWHRDLVRRIARPNGGAKARPAIVSDALAVADIDELRRFRHIATRSYDGFDPSRATRAVDAAGRLRANLPAVLSAFRKTVDPD